MAIHRSRQIDEGLQEIWYGDEKSLFRTGHGIQDTLTAEAHWRATDLRCQSEFISTSFQQGHQVHYRPTHTQDAIHFKITGKRHRKFHSDEKLTHGSKKKCGLSNQETHTRTHTIKLWECHSHKFILEKKITKKDELNIIYVKPDPKVFFKGAKNKK